MSVLRAVFFIGIFLEDIVWGWLMTSVVEFDFWLGRSNITRKSINSNLKRCSSNLKMFRNLHSSTHATQRMHHSFQTSCTMKQAPWQVSLPAREQPRVKRFKAKINSDVPRTMKQWVARTRFPFKAGAVSHAVDGNDEKCFDMNNEFKIFIDGVVIKSENTFVESCGSPFVRPSGLLKAERKLSLIMCNETMLLVPRRVNVVFIICSPLHSPSPRPEIDRFHSPATAKLLIINPEEN